MKFLFFILLFSLNAQAKDLYLTVRSDFGPAQHPLIEMTYNKRGPVTLRVLKPKDMKKFIAEQIDLRRAWKAPRSQYNTARALVEGLNSLHMNVDWLRYNFNEQIRKGSSLAGGTWEAPKSIIPLGPKKLINAPEGFDVVNEFTVSPEQVDKNSPFEAPGISWFFGDTGYNYNTRVVDLPLLANGFYVVQAIQGDQEGQVVVVVNDLRVSLQQTDTTAILRATDRTGNPVREAKVSLRNLQGSWFATGQFKEGEASLSTESQGDLIALIEAGTSFAIVDTEFYSNVTKEPDVYIMTDRPMYKPTDELHYKAIAREAKGSVSEVFAAKSRANVQLQSLEGATIAEAPSTSANDYGTFTGQFSIKDIKSDVYHVVASVNRDSFEADVRVKDYIKPLYFLTLKSNRDSLRPGDTFSIDVKAARYAGGVPKSLSLNLELQRVRYEGPEWVENAGLSETGSSMTYFFDPTKSQPIIPITVKTESGLNLTEGHKSLTFQVPKDLPGDANFNYKLILKVSAVDEDGNRAYKSLSFGEAEHEFLIQTKPSASFTTEKEKAFCKIRVRSSGGALYEGTKGRVSFYNIDYAGKKTLLGGQALVPNAQGEAQFDIPTQNIGEVISAIELSKNGKVEREETSLLVVPVTGSLPVKRVQDLTLISRKTNYGDGETAKTFVLLPEAWGVGGKNEGYLFTTLAGKDVHQTKTYKVKGLSTWIDTPIKKELGSSVYLVVSYNDSKSGYVERQISYRIIDANRILKVDTTPVAEVLNPGMSQTLNFKVSDKNGAPAKAELSVSVVDQAVLDLQAELRPRLLDFFYPMERLNLMTFISSEFQSYGYTETVAKLFRADKWFAATKAQEITRKEQDTAYFNGQLETDEQGLAKVEFPTPGNQTIWKVIVTAVDKQGRFGEGGADFKAQTDVPIFFVSTDSLRKGERFTARILINNLSPKEINFSAHIDASENLKISTADFKDTLKVKGEFRKEIEVESDASSLADLATLKLTVQYNGQNRIYNLPVKLIENSASVPVILGWNQSGEQDFALGKGEKVKRASFSIRSGLSGTVLPAIRWMVEYPHGCVEQITNTTLPSMALSQLLLGDADPREYQSYEANWWQKVRGYFNRVLSFITKFWSKLFHVGLSKEQKEILKNAKIFAERGAEKIMNLQLKDGPDKGLFTWYGEQTTGDKAMSLYVAFSILSQQKISANLKSSMESAIERLAQESGQDFGQDGMYKTFLLYLKSRLAQLTYSNSQTDLAAYNMLFDNWQRSKDLFQGALWLMSAHTARFDSGAQNDLDAKQKIVAEALASGLSAIVSSQTVKDDYVRVTWEQHIGRTGSLVAFVSRALQEQNALTQELKDKVRLDLMRRFNGRDFGSSFETGQILTHASWLIEEEIKNRKSARSPKVSIDGHTLSDSGMTASLAGYEQNLDPKSFTSAKIRVDLSEGEQASLNVEKLVPLANAQKVGPIEIDLKLKKLDGLSKELSDITVDNKVRVGDYIYLEASPHETTRFEMSDYTVLSMDLPSGFEILEEDAKFDELAVSKEKSGWERREILKGKIYYYFAKNRNWWFENKQNRVVGLVLRAGFAGHFSTGIARIEDLYDDKIWGQSTSLPVDVLRAE